MIGRRHAGDRRLRHDPFYEGPERRRNRGRRPTEASPLTENLLEPEDSENYLQVPVILSRIGSEFDYVETDGAAGRRHVETMIQVLRDRAGTPENEDHHERAKHLEAALPDAVHIRCGDNPTSECEFLSAMLVPGEPILLSYESLAQEIASRLLLHRFAKALGYRIVQWGTSLRNAG